MTYAPPPDGAPTGDPTRVGPLTVWRVWHPSPHTRTGAQLRTFGPTARFDPHPEVGPPVVHTDGPYVLYGAFLFDTAVFEVLARQPGRVVDVCPQLRGTLLTVPDDVAVFDLTSAEVAEGLGTTDAIGDDREVSYRETRRWARHLHADARANGLRYWSARHRGTDGARHGVNLALWRPAAVGPIQHQHRLVDDALWPHVVVALDVAGVAANRVDACGRC